MITRTTLVVALAVSVSPALTTVAGAQSPVCDRPECTHAQPLVALGLVSVDGQWRLGVDLFPLDPLLLREVTMALVLPLPMFALRVFTLTTLPPVKYYRVLLFGEDLPDARPPPGH